ncbi:MAG: HPr family phosphocarrier protein [Bacillota bacterium]
MEKRLKVLSETGMHARPAALIISKVSKFKSGITVSKGEKEVNLKSLLGLLSLGINQNEEITIRTNGPDEEEALTELVRFGQELGFW